MPFHKPKPVPKELLSCLDYERGTLRWNSNASYQRDVGKVAGARPDFYGYHKVKYKGKVYPVHRVIYAMFFGDDTSVEIDHIDGDRSNNKIENLRTASRAENTINTRNTPRNTTGVVGVYWYKKYKLWTAYIRLNGKNVHLGRFSHIFEAAAARISAENRHYGEFSPR